MGEFKRSNNFIIKYILNTVEDEGVQILLSFGLLVLFLISAWINIPLAFNGRAPYDFPNYYFGGKRFLEARPIYDYLEKEVFQTLGWHNRVYPADPPFTVILLSPLSLLSYTQAWILWAFISINLFIVSIFLTAKELGCKFLTFLFVLSISLSSRPFRLLLFSNHCETLVLFFLVLGWIYLKRDFTRLGLFMWVIAASLKLFPLLWILGSARLVGIRKVVEALILFAFIFSVSAYWVGSENLLAFLFDVLPRSQDWYGVVANYSLISLGYAFNLPVAAWALEAIVVVLVVYDLIIKRKPKLDPLFCLLVAASLLLSPLSWSRYLILLFPCVLLSLYSRSFQLTEKSKLLAIVGLFILWGWPEVIDTGYLELTIFISFLPLTIIWMVYFQSRKCA